MKNLLLMLFIGIIVSSCQEDDVFVLEGRYELLPTMTVSKVRMYTSKGEITDEAKIRKFLTEKSEIVSQDDPTFFASYFSFDRSSGTIDNENYLNITFNPDKATIHTNQLFGTDISTTLEAEIYKEGNLIILSTGKSAIDIPVGGIAEFFETNRIEKIRTRSHSITTPMSYLPGRTNLALLEQNGQIVLSRLAYVHSRYLGPHDNSCISESSYNILNTGFLTHVPASDTIVVQEGWLIMQKQ